MITLVGTLVGSIHVISTLDWRVRNFDSGEANLYTVLQFLSLISFNSCAGMPNATVGVGVSVTVGVGDGGTYLLSASPTYFPYLNPIRNVAKQARIASNKIDRVFLGMH